MKHNKIKYDKIKSIVLKLDKANKKKGKKPDRASKDQRPTHSHTQDYQKNTKMKAIIHI